MRTQTTTTIHEASTASGSRTVTWPVEQNFVIGRKAWLFSDTPAGAEASANLYTLVETAKVNGIDPHDYLTLVLLQSVGQE